VRKRWRSFSEFVLALTLLLLALSFLSICKQVTAQSPCGSCPSWQSCIQDCRGSECTWRCSGGGGAPPTEEPPVTEVPTQPPTQEPPGTPSPGGTPPPGETPPPTQIPPPDVTPTPGPSEWTECYTCAPWAWCATGWANVCLLHDVDGDTWVLSQDCRTAGSCEVSSPLPGTGGPPEPPCIPEYNQDGIDINRCDSDGDRGFDWGYYIWVSARVPPHRVQVDPFPRWLVAMGAPLPDPFESGEPGKLILMDYPAFTPPELCAPNGPGFSAGCWSDSVNLPDPVREEPDPGDIKNYRLGLRWRRVRSDQPDPNDLGAVPPVCWDFDEREWNVGKDYGYGRTAGESCGSTIVAHIYETSSWDKPHNGPRFLPKEEVCPGDPNGCCEQVPSGDGEWDMPAYQVKVYTTWAAEWAVQWDAWEVVGTEWSPEDSCFSRPEGEPLGIPHRDCPYADNRGCNPADSWCGQIGAPVYDWVHHSEGWYPIDLREYGSATWYYTSWAVITTGEGPWCEYEYADPNPSDTVRVPVIEVQSVLRDPCILDDSCPPGYP